MTPPLHASRVPETGITLTINGTKYQVPSSFSAVSLNDYLRSHLHLTGTKVMCREGGCGACTVHVAHLDFAGSGQMVERSINSCLCPVLSCDGWEITTVEGLGNQRKPHPIQQAMTDHYATQCGFCTPGFVMSMYSLLRDHPDRSTLTKKTIEESMDGNICRCTGYRPILDALKTFAGDAKCEVDMEDLRPRMCHKTGQKCGGKCHEVVTVKNLPDTIRDDAPPWHKPSSLDELYNIMDKSTGNVYYLVGHTGIGVYRDDPYDSYVDLKGIKELFTIDRKTPGLLKVGAGVSLTDLISLFKSESTKPGFEYLAELAAMISKTAHISVRNSGSWGGNLAMKYRHPEFPSDSYTAFLSADVRIVIGGPDHTETSHTMQDFILGLGDMTKKLILRIELKPFDKTYFFKCFKIMPRKQNAHGYINAGFRFKYDHTQKGKFRLLQKPVLAIGNISASFLQAGQTEAFLDGKDLADVSVLQRALAVLRDEINPDAKEDEASPAYKKSLALSLFYKTVLEIVGDVADTRYRTAVGSLVRQLTSGSQSYPTQEKNWPLTKPMPKLESMTQCTGEAKYIADIDEEGMLHAAFVISTQGNAAIYKIDATIALTIPGVLKVFTAADIPGKNNFATSDETPEELLAATRVAYAGQPMAIVVAVTRDAAEEGAKHVTVEYSDTQPAIVTCADAIRQKSFFKEKPEVTTIGDYDQAIAKAPKKVSGSLEMGSQTHFHMETQTAVAYPTEDGLDVEAGTQWIDHVQEAIHSVCAVDKNAINVSVKRNGGGFGAKISRNNIIAAAVGLAACLTRKPVKMHMNIWDNFKAIGKRLSNTLQYEAGFDESGKLLAVKMDIYANFGNMNNDPVWGEMQRWLDNAYKCPAWKLSYYECKTNLPANTYCRAPGSVEAIYFIETIMEHIATSLEKPSIQVKQLNFYKLGDKTLNNCTLVDPVNLQPITDKLLKDANFNVRSNEIADFNKVNRWKKRGLGVVPQRWATGWASFNYNCLIAIYHTGGTVAVTHGGIEIGQGINTKVAQVVAYELGIDLKYVKIQPTKAITNANGFTTGGSNTSELACLAAINACRELKNRIDPVQKASPGKSWEEIIDKCYHEGVDLTGRAWIAPKTPQSDAYSTYGAMITEVELDVLTGEYQVNRIDVLYDCGESMSPLIDIGQIEGAVVMGLGYYTSEEVLYESTTGQNLSPGTWKYKPPMANDIPIDLRVELLHDAPNPSGVLRSKLVAEPPLCMACSVVFALRDAIRANLTDGGVKPGWVPLNVPLTVERTQQYCAIEIPQLRFRD